MPRDIVGYEGEGRARRPIYRDETIDTSPLGGVPVGSPEAAAAIDRVAGVKAAETYGRTDYPKQSVLKGARRHQEVMAARRAAVTPEEAPMTLPELPVPQEGDDPYDALIAAAQAVQEATKAEERARELQRVAAETRRLGEQALDAAWRALHATEIAIVEGLLEDAAAAEARASVRLDEHPDGARTVKPSAAAKRQPGHHPATSKEAQEKAERRRKVMEAMERLGGDQRAVAAELGMKVNAVAMVVKHANLRVAQV